MYNRRADHQEKEANGCDRNQHRRDTQRNGAMSPTPPHNSAAPIQRIWAWLKLSAQPISLDATSSSFGTPNFISPLDANTTASAPAIIHSARFIVTY
jgi:hypothetical protein